jgi:hypothetical protein
VQCKEELPWANWVKAAQGPSQAIGAQLEHRIQPGAGQLAVGGALPAGALIRLIMIVLPLLLVLGAAYFALNRFNNSSNNLRGAGVSSGGNIAEQFKTTNPAIQEDAAARRGNE